MAWLLFHGYRSVKKTTIKCLPSQQTRCRSWRVIENYDITVPSKAVSKGFQKPCALPSLRLAVNAFIEFVTAERRAPEASRIFFQVIFGHLWSRLVI
jgi:hypothetical protein